jgi:4-hydroxybenzoate polyprenyltransferase
MSESMRVHEPDAPGEALAAEPSTSVRLIGLLTLVRLRQWPKNGLVLAGAFFTDQLFVLDTVTSAAAAALAFCFASGAVYCFNDIFDRHADATHPEKRGRPLPSGTVSVRAAAGLAAALVLLCAVVLAVGGFTWEVPAILGTYAVVNVAYTLVLRTLALLDVVVVASGFVLRLVAGSYAVDVPSSSWVVLCTGLLALFLALAKRRGDLAHETPATRPALGGYTVAFIDQALSMMGAATLVVYALFTVSDYAQGRFDAPLLYLTTFPVAVGILRYLQVVMVKGWYGSPLEIVARDRALEAVLLLWVAMFTAIIYG